MSTRVSSIDWLRLVDRRRIRLRMQRPAQDGVSTGISDVGY